MKTFSIEMKGDKREFDSKMELYFILFVGKNSFSQKFPEGGEFVLTHNPTGETQIVGVPDFETHPELKEKAREEAKKIDPFLERFQPVPVV